ncbi:hypothetical protein O9K51_08144 [Purpureocillium lavendulum]|uniref:Uncharacterized protein n=1 Tax=Purpureocillium lavendulum TaxID=1247861 RepID=A0AB34FHT8_9HYPO|nr:hypothetical protein O9K51_08144 [Purpureocillium lavendulum]
MEILALLPVLAALAAFNPSPSMAFVLARDKRDISTLSANLQNRNGLLQQRAPVPQLSTCGFLNGDPSRPRTADPGIEQHTDDTSHKFWFDNDISSIKRLDLVHSIKDIIGANQRDDQCTT